MKSEKKQDDRLTKEQFKAIIIGKGWTYRALAVCWGLSPVWVSNIARDPNRARHYDDAVMGLPAMNYLTRSLKRRQEIANAYLNKFNNKQRASTSALRYHDDLVVGAIITVMDDIGSIAEMGMRGCVFGVRTIKNTEEYGMIFENGQFDWFFPDYIDRYVAMTGLVDEKLTSYKYSSEVKLKAEYANRLFNFYP